MREKGQTEVAKTLETPVFSRGIEILTEKIKLVQRGYIKNEEAIIIFDLYNIYDIFSGLRK